MTTALAPTNSNAVSQTVDLPVDIAWPDLQAAIAGNLNKLSAEGQVKYYNALCKFTGLNPLGFPFEWITFQGKLRLYPKKECADQLRGIHKISAKIIERTFMDDICMVRVMSTMPDGREFESTGAVPYTKSMSALDKCKAIKVAETQAYRRGAFGLVGLGNIPDEDVEVPSSVSAVVETSDNSSASRVEKLNEAIEKENIIDLNPEPAPASAPQKQPEVAPTPQPVAQPEAVVPVTPVNPPDDFATPTPTPDVDKIARELELAFSKHPQPHRCIDYIIAQGKLAKGADLTAIDRVYANKILKNQDGFFRAVDTWVKGGGK